MLSRLTPRGCGNCGGAVGLTLALVWCCLATPAPLVAQLPDLPWLYTHARAIPKETTSEGSGYFAIVEGKNNKLYIGTAKYRSNAYLVEYDPQTQQMEVVVDCQREIGTTATGFAAQAKIHTRNNVGASGKIYFGTKQGYPTADEKRTDYPGGYPMVFDPETRTTKVYPIPIPHQGIISIAPDEARGVAYISTCSDERPTESSHFMILDLEKGTYRDLGETNHVYAFIVLDHLGRAYHPLHGGDILRYDPKQDKVERLRQTIDGQSPTPESHLADPDSHPINWEVSPNRRTLYAVAMSNNQLYAYDLAATGDVLPGKSLGALCASAEKSDCRALCVAANGTVWAAVTGTYASKKQFGRLVSYKPGDPAPIDYGPLAIGNPDYTVFANRKNEPLPFHHGVYRFGDGNLLPRYALLGVCAARDSRIYLLSLAPYTLHEVRAPRLQTKVTSPRIPVAGLATVYHHNSHADLILGRLLQTESLDGRGRVSSLKLASLHTDQTPMNDISRRIAADLALPRTKTVAEALTLGGNQLAVQGVLMIDEHGDYPESETGATIYPKRRMFEELFATVDKYGRRGLPVYCDKHLADTATDARWIYDEARKRDMPLMAGSTLPITWRDPPLDVRRDARLKEIHVISYHRIDIYGFHGLEALQALAERRAGGETGVVSVQTLTGDAVWQAAEQGLYDRKVFEAAVAAMRERPIPPGKRVEELAKKPVLCLVDYADGLRGCLFTLDGAAAEWTAAWKDDQGQVSSLAYVLQDARPFSHFAVLIKGLEQFVATGEPTWPVERTLLTSSLVDELLRSKLEGGVKRATPQLNIRYQCHWNWLQPLQPPPDRAFADQ